MKFISYSDKCNIYEIEGNNTIITHNTLGNERNCEESWPIRIILSYSLVIFRFLHIAIYQQDINQCLEILETPVLEKAINVKNRSKEVSFGKFWNLRESYADVTSSWHQDYNVRKLTVTPENYHQGERENHSSSKILFIL